MNVNTAIVANKFIADLKMSKFDKTVRLAVLKNYMFLNKINKDFDAKTEDLRKKMFDDKQEEAQKVQEIRERFQKSKTREEERSCIEELDKHKEFLELEGEFVKLLNEELLKEVEVELIKVDKAKFIESMVNAEIEFTPKDIDKIEIMFK